MRRSATPTPRRSRRRSRRSKPPVGTAAPSRTPPSTAPAATTSGSRRSRTKWGGARSCGGLSRSTRLVQRRVRTHWFGWIFAVRLSPLAAYRGNSAKLGRIVILSRLLVSALFGCVVAGPALAADADWSGFYLGGSAGYAAGSSANNLDIADGALTNCHFCDNIIVPGPTRDRLIAQDAGSPNLKPRGFSGGLQAGYNWQAANWVYGAEIDFGAFRQRGANDNSFILPGNTGFIGFGGVCG